MKILGVLRDALRQKSTGIIEQIPERGIVKYAKPAGVIASLVPTTNPELTPPYTGIYALKCLDAVIFSPHPRSKRTTFEMVRVMREAMQPPGRAGGSVPVHRKSERARSRNTSWPIAISRSPPAVSPWCAPPTARAAPPTASAPAIRRWSSTKPPTSTSRRATRACRRPRTSVPDVRPTATSSSTRASTTAFVAALVNEGGFLASQRTGGADRKGDVGRPRPPAAGDGCLPAAGDRARRRVRDSGRSQIPHRRERPASGPSITTRARS